MSHAKMLRTNCYIEMYHCLTYIHPWTLVIYQGTMEFCTNRRTFAYAMFSEVLNFALKKCKQGDDFADGTDEHHSSFFGEHKFDLFS